jgi:hypothetical protein
VFLCPAINKNIPTQKGGDMKKFKRVIAFVLTMLMLATSFSFAASAGIVSPQANTITTSDSLLVSVKLTEPGSVKISFIEKKLRHVDILSTGSAIDGTYATYAAVSYQSVDTKDISSEDLMDNSNFNKYYDRYFAKTVTYTSEEKIGFYTRQFTNVKPGLYKIVVDTLGEGDKIVETTYSYIAVKEKDENQSQLFEQKQTGALKVLQNLLKSLFK